MKTIESCKHCGSKLISWGVSIQNTGDAQDGRLRIHDMRAVFVLGCDYCSETLNVLRADDVAQMLPALLAAKSREDEAEQLSKQPVRFDSDEAWDLAQRVRADLDRKSCPGAFMDIAVESIGRHYGAQESQEFKPRESLLDLALEKGAVLTGKPDGSEDVTVQFPVKAWQAFDHALLKQHG